MAQKLLEIVRDAARLKHLCIIFVSVAGSSQHPASFLRHSYIVSLACLCLIYHLHI
jgi:hypothetical protein